MKIHKSLYFLILLFLLSEKPVPAMFVQSGQHDPHPESAGNRADLTQRLDSIARIAMDESGRRFLGNNTFTFGRGQWRLTFRSGGDNARVLLVSPAPAELCELERMGSSSLAGPPVKDWLASNSIRFSTVEFGSALFNTNKGMLAQLLLK